MSDAGTYFERLKVELRDLLDKHRVGNPDALAATIATLVKEKIEGERKTLADVVALNAPECAGRIAAALQERGWSQVPEKGTQTVGLGVTRVMETRDTSTADRHLRAG